MMQCNLKFLLIVKNNFCSFNDFDLHVVFCSFNRNKPNTSATRISQFCAVTLQPFCCHQTKKSQRSTCAGRHLTAVETAITNSTNASQREPFMAIVCAAPTNACANVSIRDHLMSCLTRSLRLSQPKREVRLHLRGRALLVKRSKEIRKRLFPC